MSRNFLANKSNSVRSLWMIMAFFSKMYPLFESCMIAYKPGRFINVAVINRISLRIFGKICRKLLVVHQQDIARFLEWERLDWAAFGLKRRKTGVLGVGSEV